MPNLGSSDTPVEGESFGLPAGAELTEDANGNLAIADSSGSIVLVRDETAGQWDLNNNSLTGINAIDASSINTTDVVSESVSTGDISIGESRVTATDASDLVQPDGTKIELLGQDYAVDEIANRITIEGTHSSTASSSGSSLTPNATSTITLSDRVKIRDVSIITDINIESRGVDIHDCSLASDGSTVTVSEDEASIMGNIGRGGASIVFESGTSKGVAVGNRDFSITDNGNNEVFSNS